MWPAQLAGSPESVHDAHVLLDDVNVLGLLTSVPGSWSELAGKLFEQLLEWGWHGRIGEALDKVRKRQARNADRVVIYVYFEWDACTLTPCFTLWGNKLHADWTHREGWHKCSAYLRSNVPGFEEGVDPRRTDLVLAIARCLVEAMRMMVR